MEIDVVQSGKCGFSAERENNVFCLFVSSLSFATAVPDQIGRGIQSPSDPPVGLLKTFSVRNSF
jgi:hypothetical protein